MASKAAETSSCAGPSCFGQGAGEVTELATWQLTRRDLGDLPAGEPHQGAQLGLWDTGLDRMPFKKFAANQAWLELVLAGAS